MGRSDPSPCPFARISNLILPIPPAVEDAADLHDVVDHNIEYSEVVHRDPIIRVLALPAAVIRLERLREGEPFMDRLFHRVKQALRGDGIAKPARDIIHDLVQVVLKQREDAQLIVLFAHGCDLSRGRRPRPPYSAHL